MIIPDYNDYYRLRRLPHQSSPLTTFIYTFIIPAILAIVKIKIASLAIPHIMIDGEHEFELVIAGCEAGINFTKDLPPVYAAFILVGLRDEKY